MESIQVVNNEILMADFGKVGMKALEELSFKKVTESDFITLTKDGKYLLNSADDCSEKYIPVLKIISVFPNRLLDSINGFCSFTKVFSIRMEGLTNKQIKQLLKENELSALKQVYDIACKWEKSRRKLVKKGGEKLWQVFLHKLTW